MKKYHIYKDLLCVVRINKYYVTVKYTENNLRIYWQITGLKCQHIEVNDRNNLINTSRMCRTHPYWTTRKKNTDVQ